MAKTAKQALKNLELALKEIEGLAAWRSLEDHEKRKSDVLRYRSDSTERDLKNEIGGFWMLILDFEKFLIGKPSKSKAQMRSRLRELISRVREFRSEKFLSP